MNQNESNSNMSNIELPREKALKKIVRQLIDDGRDGARAMEIAALSMDDDEIEVTLTPKYAGQYLHNNRDLGFATIEKNAQDGRRTVWRFHPKE